MRTAPDRSQWKGDVILNGFLAAFRSACGKLAAGEAEVCTLALSILGDTDQTDVKVYVVREGDVTHQVIEEALNRVVTDETFVRGFSARSST